MNPLFLLVPVILGLYIWNRNKKETTAVLAGTSAVQVTAASYNQNTGLWAITANVTQPDGAIASMTVSIAGSPVEQPTIDEVEAAVGQAQTQMNQPTSAEF